MNFLIRNKWRNIEEVQKLKNVPILFLSSLQVHSMHRDKTHARGYYHPISVLPFHRSFPAQSPDVHLTSETVPLQDEMLPAAQMKELYDTHAARPWRWVHFEQGRHMDAYDTCAPLYWPPLIGFINDHFDPASSGL